MTMKIDIELENCYGINKLKHSLDFGDKKVIAIYAGNGTMKTSLAKTLHDLQSSKESKDEIYEEKVTVRDIKKDGQDLKAEEVLVIKSYQEKYQSSEIAKLLFSENLKEKYEKERTELDNEKNDFLEAIRGLSGLSYKDIEEQVCEVFYKEAEENKFLEVLTRIKDEIKEEPLDERIRYSLLFNGKTKEIIKDKDFLESLESYTRRYEELLKQSTYFKKGIFNHISPDKIVNEFEKIGFF